MVEGDVSTFVVKEAVAAARVIVIADDLPRAIDPKGLGALEGADGGRGIVEGGVDATAVQEAVKAGAAVRVPADDLARIIDPSCGGAAVVRAGQRIVEGCVDLDRHDTRSSVIVSFQDPDPAESECARIVLAVMRAAAW
jgi:hypothetical protein